MSTDPTVTFQDKPKHKSHSPGRSHHPKTAHLISPDVNFGDKEETTQPLAKEPGFFSRHFGRGRKSKKKKRKKRKRRGFFRFGKNKNEEDEQAAAAVVETDPSDPGAAGDVAVLNAEQASIQSEKSKKSNKLMGEDDSVKGESEGESGSRRRRRKKKGRSAQSSKNSDRSADASYHKSDKKSRKSRFSFRGRRKPDRLLDPEPTPPVIGEEQPEAAEGGDRRSTNPGDGLRFTYDLSAVSADHGITDAELRQNISTKVEQIQTCRTEVGFIKAKIDDLQADKEAKQAELLLLDGRQKELERQLAREMELRNVYTTDCDATERQLERARRKKQALDMKDKYTFQVQQKVHEELSASMKGYSDAYSTVMCDKMKTLEVWHGVFQTYLEKTACMTESHQKAKQAFSAASVKYKRLKTSRDQLSSELRNLQEETSRETAAIVQDSQQHTTHDREKLQRYTDQLQRCLVNRDLTYEAVLESKDLLVARVKDQMDILHAAFRRVETDGLECLKTFTDLMEQRKVKPFNSTTTKLVAVLPLESEYLSHLEKITKVLSDYVLCMHEIDVKREDLLVQRAAIMGTKDQTRQLHKETAKYTVVQ